MKTYKVKKGESFKKGAQVFLDNTDNQATSRNLGTALIGTAESDSTKAGNVKVKELKK